MLYICQIAQLDISSMRILSSNNIDQLSFGGGGQTGNRSKD